MKETTLYEATPVSVKPEKEGDYPCYTSLGVWEILEWTGEEWYGDLRGSEDDPEKVIHWLRPVPVSPDMPLLKDFARVLYDYKWDVSQCNPGESVRQCTDHYADILRTRCMAALKGKEGCNEG